MNYVVYVCDLGDISFIKPGKLYQLKNNGYERGYFVDEDGDRIRLDYDTDTIVISIP